MVKLTNMKHASKDYVLLNHIASMYVTDKNEVNEELKAGTKVSYIDCFKGVNKRRTTNSCLIWSMQKCMWRCIDAIIDIFLPRGGFGC
jgi:hypothetical protein